MIISKTVSKLFWSWK